MLNSVLNKNEIYSTMNGGKPLKTYKKTIMAQAAINVWDSFTDSPTQIIVKGDPNRNPDSCLIDVWTEKEKVFFERTNRTHFQSGVLISFDRPEVEEVVEKPIEQYTDEELSVVINSKFMSLSNTLNKITSTAVLFRMVSLAKKLEKSEKIIKAIEARASELQASEYLPKASEQVEE
jgi:hypothetical protein